MASLSSKVVVVTGAASGIGRATATLLASHSVLLSLCDVNNEALEIVKEELEEKTQANIFTSVFDIRSQEGCNAWIRDTVAHFGQPIYGAANVAGVVGPSLAQERGTIRNITDEEFDWVMDINLKGVLNCLRAELPDMQEGRDGRGGGAIVNVASLAGLIGVPYDVPYVASKHAVVGITKVAAKEEGSRAIRVNAVCPGIINTPQVVSIEAQQGDAAAANLFGQGAPGALGRRGEAGEVADLIVYLLSPQSSFINGVAVPIEGGWTCSV